VRATGTVTGTFTQNCARSTATSDGSTEAIAGTGALSITGGKSSLQDARPYSLRHSGCGAGRLPYGGGHQ